MGDPSTQCEMFFMKFFLWNFSFTSTGTRASSTDCVDKEFLIPRDVECVDDDGDREFSGAQSFDVSSLSSKRPKRSSSRLATALARFFDAASFFFSTYWTICDSIWGLLVFASGRVSEPPELIFSAGGSWSAICLHATSSRSRYAALNSCAWSLSAFEIPTIAPWLQLISFTVASLHPGQLYLLSSDRFDSSCSLFLSHLGVV